MRWYQGIFASEKGECIAYQSCAIQIKIDPFERFT